MSHQHGTLEDTIYFGFVSNDTSGSGADGSSEAYDVRLGGGTAGAAPIHSAAPVLLTHGDYGPGCYEVAVPATAANGFASGNTYLVYTTLTADGQTPGSCLGSFTLAGAPADVTRWQGTVVATPDTAGYPKVTIKDGTGTGEIDLNAGAIVSVVTTTTNTDMLSAAAVNAEVDTALADIKLDHLVAVADSDDPVDDSIIAKLANSGATADWSAYANTTDSLTALRDRGDAAWTTGAGGTPPDLLQSTTILSLSTQTSFTLAAGSTDDDAYVGQAIVVTDSATATQKAVGWIRTYSGATRLVGLAADPGVFTMANGDTVDIVVNVVGVADNASVAADLILARTTLASIQSTVEGIENVATEARLAELDAPNLPADVGTINTATGGLGGAAMRGTDSAALASAYTSARAGYLDNINGHTAQTGDNFARIGATGSGLTTLSTAAAVAAVKVDTAATVVDTANLNDTTHAEPGQGAPPVTTTLIKKIDYLYKSWRNKSTQDATDYKLYADDTTTVDQKATVSDDTTTATRGEVGTGP